MIWSRLTETGRQAYPTNSLREKKTIDGAAIYGNADVSCLEAVKAIELVHEK